MKKIISILLVAIMLFSIIPMAYAEETQEPEQPILYDLWVNGVQFTSQNLTVDCGTVDEIVRNANYDATNNVLTLNNAVISSGNTDSSNNLYGLCCEIEGLIIKVVGTNSISATGKSLGEIDDNLNVYGIGGSKSVTVELESDSSKLTIVSTSALENATKSAFQNEPKFTCCKFKSDTSVYTDENVELIYSAPIPPITFAGSPAEDNNISYFDQGEETYSGSNLEALPKKHTTGTATILEDGVKTGSIFAGWYATKACTGDAVKTIPAESAEASYTYYAKWIPININYYDQGGATYSGSNINDLPKTHTTGTATTLLDGEKIGYNFGGWYITTDCTGDAVKTIPAESAEASYTYYAKWLPLNISYYDQGEGTYSGSNLDKLPETHSFGTATTLVDGVKAGYKFGGWFKDKECATTAITSIGATDITEDLSLFALWKKYEVSYITTSSTGGSAKYDLSGSTTATGAFTTTSQKIEVASTDKFVITATPSSSYYAKIYTDSKTLASSSKGTAVSYTLTQSDIESGITVKVLYSTNPITGDGFDPMLWVIAMASATVGVAITIAKKRAHK